MFTIIQLVMDLSNNQWHDAQKQSTGSVLTFGRKTLEFRSSENPPINDITNNESKH